MIEMSTIIRVLIPVVSMAGLGLIFGVGLAYALKIFNIEVDPTLALLISKLPGSNCGACGAAGCAGFAEMLKKGEMSPSGCAVSNTEGRQALAKILGVDFEHKVKHAAVVLCNGGAAARDRFVYKGIANCQAASLVFGGQKACVYGCLGFGDCAKVCPFGAITMGEDGLPKISLEKCTACGKCVKICSKKILTLIPADKHFYVKCSFRDIGALVSKVCASGCIACRKCEKACPRQAIRVETNLARIDYKQCQNIGACSEACPTRVIKKQ